MKTRVSLKYWLEYILLRMAVAPFQIMPLALTRHTVCFLSYLFISLPTSLRKETFRRIQEALPGTTKSRAKKIAYISLYNMVMGPIEMLKAHQFTKKWFREHIGGIEKTLETIHELRNGSGGVVVALPHAGNWDLAGYACGLFDVRVMSLMRKQNNPLVNYWFLKRMRNFEVVNRESKSAMLKIGHHLKDGGMFAILPDVRSNSMDLGVNIFGHEVQIKKGMARFARISNVPILPLIIRRTKGSNFSLTAGEPIYPDLNVNVADDQLRMTRQVFTFFEKEIKESPEQWFWYNKRWLLTPQKSKTR